MLAILCSGQGAQGAEMFALTARAPEAADLFAHATALLDGNDPRDMITRMPSEALHENRVGQLLCTLQAVAAAALLRAGFPSPLLIAGYSVGEVAAWGVAEIFDGATTLRLVARRAELMDAHSRSGDGLAFVRGLSRTAVEVLCRRFDTALAIVNPGNGYVVGGAADAVGEFLEAARGQGASRVGRLPVMVASHTRCLAPASAAFRAVLAAAPVAEASLSAARSGRRRLISGIDGATVVDQSSGLDKLALQISQPVEWSACLDACVEARASAFLELGPGRALSEMAANAFPATPARALSEFSTIDGVRRWLARVVG